MPGTGTKSETADYFASTQEIQRAHRNGELSLLYIYDSEADRKRIAKFEKAMFKNEQLAIGLKLFRRVSLDAAKDAIVRERVGKKIPTFIAFNAKGKRVGEVSLKGYKASPTTLFSLLNKASKGHGKMSLVSFVKKYRGLLNSIDKVEKQKDVIEDQLSRVRDSKSKMKKLRKQQGSIDKTEQKLFRQENEMLRAAGAIGFTRVSMAKR